MVPHLFKLLKEIMCCIVCCETSLFCAGLAATKSKWVKNYPYIGSVADPGGTCPDSFFLTYKFFET